MTEDQLQYQCYDYYHNTHKTHRKLLFRTENKTSKGAKDKGLGLIKGVSDLQFVMEDGRLCPIELKVNDTRHVLNHLREQYQWTSLIKDRSGLAFFCFSFEHFKQIIDSLVEFEYNKGFLIMESDMTMNYILNLLAITDTKTVKLHYIMSNYCTKKNSIPI